MILLIIIIVMRLGCPVELFYAKTIQLPFLLNPVMELMWYEVYPGVSILIILGFIWVIVSIIKLVLYIRAYLLFQSVVHKIQSNAVKSSVRELSNSLDLKDYPVYISEAIESPRIIGKSKIIYLPNVQFSSEQLDSILAHEIQHIDNYDFYKKQLIELLIIIYWWFPPVYRLRRQYSIYSELRADGLVTKNATDYENLEYAKTLVEVQKLLENAKNDRIDQYSSFFLTDGTQILKWRIDNICSYTFIKRTGTIILASIVIIPFLSNCIIFEPKFDAPKENYIDEQQWSESYILKTEGGEYYLISGETMTLISDINDPILREIPIFVTLD